MDFILNGIVNAFDLLVHKDPETYSAILASVKVSGYSIGVSLMMGIPLGFFFGVF